MKVKKLIELLKKFKEDTDISFVDFSYITNDEKIEYDIEWIDKTNAMYTNGYGIHEKARIYLTKKNK